MAEQMHIWNKYKSAVVGYTNQRNVDEPYVIWPGMGAGMDNCYPGYSGYSFSYSGGYLGTGYVEKTAISTFVGKHVFVMPEWVVTCTSVAQTGTGTWTMTLRILQRCDGVYAKDEFVSAITAAPSTYPSNGRHTDGFWYVYQGLDNRVPVITCTDTDKGELEDGFTVHYSVTDEDAADSITVTEAIDGVTLRSFEATRAVDYTADVTALTWLKLLNGEHTLTITAVDNRGGTAVKSIKFTKAVHVIEFTLSTPLACDAAATKAMTQMLAAVPAGALVQVFACNNGYDENPTWVDVTLKVLNNEKIFFANTEKTADKWGYNVRVIIDRNNTTGDCFITSIGGNFE